MSASLSRRQFLAVPAALGAAALVPHAFTAALARETPPLPDLSDWGNVRAQFDLDPRWSHFASFFIASHPAPVRDAIEAWRRAMGYLLRRGVLSPEPARQMLSSPFPGG